MDFARKPVLVLGASGFIGSRVVTVLRSHPVYHPVAASRRSAVTLDATDPTAMRTALRNVDCVVNAIAGKAMVRATEVLLDAARLSPPRRIIHLSSMAIYGAASGRVSEDHRAVEPISRYGYDKILCERLVRKYVEDGGDAVILRPTCVFGAGGEQWTARMAALLRARRIGDLGSAGDGICNLAFIDDLVAGIVAALDAPDVSGKTFNISSSADLTWNDFLVTFAKALGATPVRRIGNRRLMIETKLLAPLRRVAAMAVRSPATEAITPSLAALWRQDIRIDCSAARASLALPQTSVTQMIAAANRSKEPVHL